MSAWEIMFVYLLGAVGYGGIEMLWRGRTHWTMLVLGGLCFLIIYAVTALGRGRLALRWLLCAGAVTGLEFAAGCLLNLGLGWDVWDYSGLPGNLLGQVCPFYALCWLLLVMPCSALAYAIRRWMFGARPRRGKGNPVL